MDERILMSNCWPSWTTPLIHFITPCPGKDAQTHPVHHRSSTGGPSYPPPSDSINHPCINLSFFFQALHIYIFQSCRVYCQLSSLFVIHTLDFIIPILHFVLLLLHLWERNFPLVMNKVPHLPTYHDSSWDPTWSYSMNVALKTQHFTWSSILK